MAPPQTTRHYARNHPAYVLQQATLRGIHQIVEALDIQLAIEQPLLDQNLNIGRMVDYYANAAPKIDESLRR
jgi:hypothetical protein